MRGTMIGVARRAPAGREAGVAVEQRDQGSPYADAGAQLDALATTLAHVRSETTNSVDTIMDTVSRSVCYIMPDASDPLLPISVLTRREDVRTFYEQERGFLEVVDSADLVEISTGWYVFHEGFATTTEVRTGAAFTHEYVVLFPTAPDGIIGEILWPRQSLADLYAGRPRPESSEPGADRRRANRAGHDRYLDALRHGDAAAAAGQWHDEARVAVRQSTDAPRVVHGTGRDVVGSRIDSLLGAVYQPEVRVLNRVVGEWYVFVDWVVRGDARGGGGGIELRMASIHPMRDGGLIGGELGYGLDAHPATP